MSELVNSLDYDRYISMKSHIYPTKQFYAMYCRVKINAFIMFVNTLCTAVKEANTQWLTFAPDPSLLVGGERGREGGILTSIFASQIFLLLLGV